MSVVAPETLRDRVEQYADRADDPTVPRALGALGLDPDVNSEERTVVENVLADAPDADREDDGEQGGPTA